MKNLNMKLKASLALLLLVGVVGGGMAVKAFSSDKGAINVFENGANVTLNQDVTQQEETLGAAASPDSPFNWASWGGVKSYYGSMSMSSATTTVCAIQSPAVTSTLDFASANFDVASTTASIVTMARSATQYVTTTLLSNELSISANAGGLVIASSTLMDANGGNVFAPSQWLVISMRGGAGNPTLFSPEGKCKAVFQSVY